jgi:hypothetical protein
MPLEPNSLHQLQHIRNRCNISSREKFSSILDYNRCNEINHLCTKIIQNPLERIHLLTVVTDHRSPICYNG